jgi:hypothetical protein
VIKQRWWWSITNSEDLEANNFLWTQWRKNKVLAGLETKFPVESKQMLALKREVDSEQDLDPKEIVTEEGTVLN